MEFFDVLTPNGEFAGEVATREDCHKKGLWHRAVYGFIFNKNGDVLLQKRSRNKKLWPNLWDITAGGHVLAGEFGQQALIREIKEELNINVTENEIRYLVGSTSTNIKGEIINNHFNECYIITKNIDISEIKLQEDEVEDIRWFTKKEILDRIENNFDGITDKEGPWNFLKKYYEVIGRKEEVKMIEDLNVLCHSSIKIMKKKVVYIDPFKIDKNYKDADIIFITHNHYDHFSKEDIEKIKNTNTKIIAPKGMANELIENGFNDDKITLVQPNEKYVIDDIKYETIPAYNINKKFHPKENGWVGYVIEIDNVKYYIAGDTDITEENKKVICDVALVPVGGTYTMNFKEAANLINQIKPKIAVPIHYGSIVGTEEDAVNFSKLLIPELKCKTLIGG